MLASWGQEEEKTLHRGVAPARGLKESVGCSSREWRQAGIPARRTDAHTVVGHRDKPSGEVFSENKALACLDGLV